MKIITTSISAKEQLSKELLSKLNEFDADHGNHPLEGADIYYDSQYLRFYFTGVTEDSAKYEVLSFLRSQGFDIQLNQLYTSKYGSSVTVFLPISSLPKPSTTLESPNYTTLVYPDDFRSTIPEQILRQAEHIVIKTPDYPDNFYSLLPNLKTAEILSGAKTVYGFARCEKLTTVFIQDGVRTIDENAFSSCTSLKSINIPSSITSIGDWAFYKCTNLTSIAFEENSHLTTIGEFAFSDCTSLHEIALPSSLEHIGENAFNQCDSLTGVYISDIAAWFKISFDNLSSNPLDYAQNLYLNNKLVTRLTVPSTLKTMKNATFYNCTSLTSLVIENGVENIGASSFRSCSSLKSIEIPKSVKSIEDFSFSECDNLTAITIPNTVQELGYYVFSDCPKLEHITFTGTIKEWKDLAKGRDCFSHTVELHCTDGTINFK